MDTSNPFQPSRLKGKRSEVKENARVFQREVYWISLSLKEGARPFGAIRGGEFILNDRGKALAASWRELGYHRPGLESDSVAITSTQIQGILVLSGKGELRPTLAEAVRIFKVLSARRLAQSSSQVRRLAPVTGNLSVTGAVAGKGPAGPWKKGYSERLLSGAEELSSARKALKKISA